MTEYLRSFQSQMEKTPQDPLWHGEGNVWIHTQMVCDALESLPEYRQADADTRRILHLAAIFHDVGKTRATRLEDGRWTSHGHARISAQITRQLLWQEHGLCGAEASQQLREAVCALVQHHGLPIHAIDKPDGLLRLRRFAANGSLVPQVMVKNLCILSKADILGRVCDDQQELLDKVALCEELAREGECCDGPYPFPSEHTRFSWLAGRGIPADCPLYDDCWGEVILMSGLPGTGKDTWIQANCPELPMVSLDEIRRKLGILPTDNQSRVLEAGREQAKAYLRKKQPFVWNATNLSTMVRGKQLDLFARYGARTRIVYLETAWQEQLRRNQNRPDAVPQQAICKMLDTLTPPEQMEAHRVDWICV